MRPVCWTALALLLIAPNMSIVSAQDSAAGEVARPTDAAPGETEAEVGSEQSPDSEPSLALEQLIGMALANNPTLGQSRAETWKAQGQTVQAGLYPNTTFGIVAAEVGNEGSPGQHGLYVNQEFVTGGKLWIASQAAGFRQQASTFEAAAQQYRVTNDVRLAFYQTLALNRLLELADLLVQVAERGEQLTQIRIEQLEGSKIDLLQARTERQRATLVRQNAEAEYEAAWRRLAATVGLPQLTQTSLQGDLENGLPELEWETTRSRLLSQSPQLGRARSLVARSRWALQRAQVEPLPNVQTQASLQQDFGSDHTFFGFQVGVELPNHDRNQGNILTAQMELVRACREIERLELLLSRQLADRFQTYQVNRQQTQAFRDEILPTSRESLQLSRSAFEGGELSFIQLLTAQRTYAQANIEYIRSLSELWQSVIAIDGLLLVNGLESPAEFDSP